MKGRIFFSGLLGATLAFSPSLLAEDIGYTKACPDVQAYTDLKKTRLDDFDTRIKDTKAKFGENNDQYKSLVDKKAEWQYRYNLIDKNANCDVKTGLPHLIADGRWSHAGDFIIPSLLWIYLTGALAWAGRLYLAKTRNPMDEVLIDLSKAIPALLSGLLWPVQAIPELLSGSIRDSKVKP